MAKRAQTRRYSYSGRKKGPHLSPLWLIPLGVVVVLAVVLLCIAVYLQRYMVYSRDGGVMVLPGQTEAEPDLASYDPVTDLDVVEEVQILPSETEPEPDTGQLLALELSLEDLLSGQAEDLAAQAGANAVILDMKPASGVLNWPSERTLGDLAPAVSEDAAAVEEALTPLKEDGLTLIARVSLFQDAFLVQAGAAALEESEDWLDPADPEVQSYLCALSEELAGLGFSQLILSDWGYPPDWGEVPEEERTQAGLTMLTQLSRTNGISLGLEADLSDEDALYLFGLTPEEALEYADRIWSLGEVSEDVLALFPEGSLEGDHLVLQTETLDPESDAPAQAVYLPAENGEDEDEI